MSSPGLKLLRGQPLGQLGQLLRPELGEERDGAQPPDLDAHGREPCPHVCHLLVVQALVRAACAHELRVRPLLDELSLVEHEDVVAARRQRQPVRDADRRPPPRQLVERLEDLRLRPRVERARRLVQDENGGIPQQRARDRKALALAAAHAHAALAQHGVRPGRERLDPALQPRRPGGLEDFGVGRPFAGQRDVLAQRRVEQEGVLEDEPDLAAERGDLQLAQVTAVVQDAPFLRIPEAEQEIDDGALPRARGADDRDVLPGGDGQAEVVQDRPAGLVAEPDALEPDLVRRARERLGVRRLLDRDRLVQHLQHAVERAGRALHLLADVRERRDRLEERGQETDERDQRPQAHVPLDHEVAAHADDHELPEGDRDADARLEERAEDDDPHDRAQQPSDRAAVGADRAPLQPEGLHHRLRRQVLLDGRGDLPVDRLHLEARPAQPREEQDVAHAEERNDDEDERAQDRAEHDRGDPRPRAR